VTVKTFISLHKIFISNKCCSFELAVRQRILKNMSPILQNYYCTTENDFWRIMWHCSNDAENLALITGINKNTVMLFW